MKHYMLDTNMVSHLLKGYPNVLTRIQKTPMASLCISCITEAELMYGLAKRPEAKKLQALVRELLLRINSLPWTSTTAQKYGQVRTLLENKGKNLAPMDLMIATHALELGAVLVTNDSAFSFVPHLKIEDWT